MHRDKIGNTDVPAFYFILFSKINKKLSAVSQMCINKGNI